MMQNQPHLLLKLIVISTVDHCSYLKTLINDETPFQCDLMHRGKCTDEIEGDSFRRGNGIPVLSVQPSPSIRDRETDTFFSDVVREARVDNRIGSLSPLDLQGVIML